MKDINQINLIGRMVYDCDLKQLPSGVTAAKFAIAVNTTKKEGEQYVDHANFFDIKGIGRLWEAVGKYLTKGKQVAISGHLEQERWQNQDGQNRSKVVVFAENIQLLGGKSDNDSGASAPQSGGDMPSF